MKLKDMNTKLMKIQEILKEMEEKICLQDITDNNFLINLKKYEKLLNEYFELKNVLTISQINTVIQEHPHITLNQVSLEKEQLEKLQSLYSKLINCNLCNINENNKKNIELINKRLKKTIARYNDINELFNNISLNTNVFSNDINEEETEREKVAQFIEYLQELWANEEKVSLSDIPDLINSFIEKEQEPVTKNIRKEEKLLNELKELTPVAKELETHKVEDEKDISLWEEISTVQKIYSETSNLSKVLEFCELKKCPYSMREIEVYINKKFHSNEEDSFYDPVEHMHTHNKE
mgnify:CR=1 FL=1